MKYLNRGTAVMMYLVVVLATIVGACAQQQERTVERERKEMFRQRRIIVNDDGAPGELYRGDPASSKGRFGLTLNTQVDTYFVCVGSTSGGPGGAKINDALRYWFWSDSDAAADTRLPANNDKLTRAYLTAARAAGMEIFASVRMNDVHDAFATELRYPLKVQRPDLLLSQQHEWPDVDAYFPSSPHIMGAKWSGFDYAKEEVRAHFRDFILGYCREYDFDGMELDFFRNPLFFKFGEEAENMDKMTDLVQQVRAGLNEIGEERGRPYLLTARVPDNLQMCRMTGLDVEQWLKEGLLDLLIIGGGYMPWSGRIKELIDLAHEHGVPAYPCVNYLRGDPAKVQAYTSNFWALGADGIYIFNYNGGEDGSEIALLKQIGDPEILLGLDKYYQPDNGCSIFYLALANPPGQFPVRLIHGTPIELVVGDDLPKAQKLGILNAARLTVKVANMDEAGSIGVVVNGVELPDSSVKRVDEQTFEIPVQAPPLRRGINQITVLPGRNSIGLMASEVTWLELSVRYEHN